MIRAIIIDDEKGSIDSLIWELENFQDRVKLEATTQSPKEGLELIKTIQPDLVFLDIHMPEMDGFQFLKTVKDVNFKIIFTTAYDQYAIKAFKVNALDYLLKPIDEDDLSAALTKVETASKDMDLAKRLEYLFKSFGQQNSNYKHIIVPTSDGLEFIEIDKIQRCQSDSNYTYIHIVDEKPILIAKTLKEVEDLLEGNEFYRIHHSHLINVRYIRKYNNGKAGSITMKDGTLIPISRRRKKEFLDEI